MESLVFETLSIVVGGKTEFGYRCGLVGRFDDEIRRELLSDCFYFSQ